MPPENAPGSRAANPAASGGDWASQVTARVEDVVSVVRDKTVRPAYTAVRYIVVGVLGAVMSSVLGVLFAIGTIRVLNTEVWPDAQWASYLLVGGIFTGLGLFLMRR